MIVCHYYLEINQIFLPALLGTWLPDFCVYFVLFFYFPGFWFLEIPTPCLFTVLKQFFCFFFKFVKFVSWTHLKVCPLDAFLFSKSLSSEHSRVLEENKRSVLLFLKHLI